MGIASGTIGAVTFVQRFGADRTGSLAFVALPAPTPEEIGRLTERIARRLTGLVERHVADETRTGALMEETVAALREALSAAVWTPRLGLDGGPPAPGSPLCARVAGFTLHAGQRVGVEDRTGLERLCRYGLQSPFSQERPARGDDGRVVYTLRRPWPRRPMRTWSGTTGSSRIDRRPAGARPGGGGGRRRGRVQRAPHRPG